MISSIQKELLKTLINLYRTSDGKSVKGEDIAEVMERNPGTIRNQMQTLRILGLSKGVPGPHGGYKPTIEAYHMMNIKVTDEESIVPIYRGKDKISDVSVAKIEFTSVPNPGECEAVIKVLGEIKDLDLGEKIKIGPTPVNHLILSGEIVGRDDMDNILLLDATTIRSIPKKKVNEVGTTNLIVLKENDTIRDVSKVLSSNSIEGAPVLNTEDKVVGMVTLSDIVKALANFKEEELITKIMSKSVIKVKENTMISEAIELIHKNKIGRLLFTDVNDKLKGIITRTDILNIITYYNYKN